MSVVKQRLNFKVDDGYDTIHLETSSSIVLREDGSSVESALVDIVEQLSSKADATHDHPDMIATVNTALSGINGHVANKSNPHGVTAAQIGAAAASHTHTAEQVGAIPVSASCNKNWYWSGQEGQPSWLWGSNDGVNMYVYNPAAFSVNYANSAGYSGNSGGLAGLDQSYYVKHYKRDRSAEELNNPNYPEPYIASYHDGTALGLPAGWWHIQYFRHMDNNGFGFQTAYPLSTGDPIPRYRYSTGTSWSAWIKFHRNVISSTADIAAGSTPLTDGDIYLVYE